MPRVLQSLASFLPLFAAAALPGCYPVPAGLREPPAAVRDALRVGVELGEPGTFVTRYLYRVDGGLVADVRLAHRGPTPIFGGEVGTTRGRTPTDARRDAALQLEDGRDTGCDRFDPSDPRTPPPYELPTPARRGAATADDEPWASRVGPYACPASGGWVTRWRYLLPVGAQVAVLRVDATASTGALGDPQLGARVDAVARALLRSMRP
jgi:hypothetical protein